MESNLPNLGFFGACNTKHYQGGKATEKIIANNEQSKNKNMASNHMSSYDI